MENQVLVLLQVGSQDLMQVRFVVNNKDSTHIRYAFLDYWLVALRGNVSVKRTVSGVFHVSSSRHECACTMLFAMASPNPVPDNSLSRVFVSSSKFSANPISLRRR
jgi:hypothetical protein